MDTNEKLYLTYCKRADLYYKISMITFVILLVWLIISIKLINLSVSFLISTCVLMVLHILLSVLFLRKVAKKQMSLKEIAYGKEKYVLKTGLFAELWDEYYDNRLEQYLDDLRFLKQLKVNHIDDYNCIIDIRLVRAEHEICIEFGNDSVSVIIDEETDNSFETELFWSDFQSLFEVFQKLGEVIKLSAGRICLLPEPSAQKDFTKKEDMIVEMEWL